MSFALYKEGDVVTLLNSYLEGTQAEDYRYNLVSNMLENFSGTPLVIKKVIFINRSTSTEKKEGNYNLLEKLNKIETPLDKVKFLNSLEVKISANSAVVPKYLVSKLDGDSISPFSFSSSMFKESYELIDIMRQLFI